MCFDLFLALFDQGLDVLGLGFAYFAFHFGAVLGKLDGAPAFSAVVVPLGDAEDEVGERQSVEAFADCSGDDGFLPSHVAWDGSSVSDWLLQVGDGVHNFCEVGERHIYPHAFIHQHVVLCSSLLRQPLRPREIKHLQMIDANLVVAGLGVYLKPH